MPRTLSLSGRGWLHCVNVCNCRVPWGSKPRVTDDLELLHCNFLAYVSKACHVHFYATLVLCSQCTNTEWAMLSSTQCRGRVVDSWRGQNAEGGLGLKCRSPREGVAIPCGRLFVASSRRDGGHTHTTQQHEPCGCCGPHCAAWCAKRSSQ